MLFTNNFRQAVHQWFSSQPLQGCCKRCGFGCFFLHIRKMFCFMLQVQKLLALWLEASLQIICKITVLYQGVKERAVNSFIDRGTELWMKNWQQILESRSKSKRVYTNLYFIYDTLWDSAYIGDHPNVLLLVQQKNNTHPQEYVKKVHWLGEGLGLEEGEENNFALTI